MEHQRQSVGKCTTQQQIYKAYVQKTNFFRIYPLTDQLQCHCKGRIWKKILFCTKIFCASQRVCRDLTHLYSGQNRRPLGSEQRTGRPRRGSMHKTISTISKSLQNTISKRDFCSRRQFQQFQKVCRIQFQNVPSAFLQPSKSCNFPAEYSFK